ncbi:ATP-dependent DNA helicase [soil metagenome]
MISAIEIADALGKPRPTSQQQRVIEAPLAPALVIAGAGSGKTETMANRVLWLLANGLVEPQQILGLTFTRKAAGELATRIRERIVQLAAAGLIATDYDEFEKPTVATYNSFSNTLYRENAALIGRESDGTVLGEASAWQLARSIVVAASDDRLPALGKSVDTLTKAVLALSRAVNENLADVAQVRRFAADFAALAELPPGGRGVYEEAATLAATVGSLDLLLDLAAAYDDAKLTRGLVEYSDQVALALRIVRAIPRVREEARDQFRVVLLDEYQDTSVVQTWLLSELFGRHPVMAVGDPNQSIYGWRGASAANLEQFAAQFCDGAAERFSLSTSWRNGHGILRVANALVEPFAGSGVGVDRLEAGPLASDRAVEVVFDQTLSDEADAAAVWLSKRLAVAPGVLPPTAAMLFRARKTQAHFVEALRKYDVPFHVLGIGGLLEEPEIADLVSALRVINDPTAGSELVRLLAGSRWRIGARDLHVLSRVASWLRDHDYAQRVLDDAVKAALRSSVAEGEGGSIVDALDFVANAREGHSQLERFSAAGLSRLREAGATFQRLRARAGLDLLDFVTLVEQDFMLDIEVVANEHRPQGGANREAFFDALAGYLAVDDGTSLSGFLAWLREAEWRDNLGPRPEDAEPGTVQLLTVHGSKGLEWDLVVVPRFVESELPATSREPGWLAFGSLPYEFRGDAAELPEFGWRAVDSRKALIDARADFVDRVRERHEREERRLAYVAVTRARDELLITGSFWATQSSARPPSAFLRELESTGIIGALPERPELEANPLGDDAATIVWPRDPLGHRRTRVENAAELVRSARPGQEGIWRAEVELLLAERAARFDSATKVALPSRVPASRFKDFVTEPGEVAAALRRPMPERPYRATRLGTLFHSWVENRYGVDGSSEQLDALLTDTDDGERVDDAALAGLQATFERSEWAVRKPVDVEREIHLVLDSQVIICKIDAVYEADGRFEIVDWKTGKAPRDADDLEAKQLQLALYRLAYSRWREVPLDDIDAVFYFVADDRVIRPERLFDEAELVALWRRSLA